MSNQASRQSTFGPTVLLTSRSEEALGPAGVTPHGYHPDDRVRNSHLRLRPHVWGRVAGHAHLDSQSREASPVFPVPCRLPRLRPFLPPWWVANLDQTAIMTV